MSQSLDDGDPLLREVRDLRPADGDLLARTQRRRVFRELTGHVSASDRVARFEVLELLGSGAMGRVFRAHDPSLDRIVALKVLRAPGDDACQRILMEARALARLGDPNVVAVYEAGEADGEVYLVMELVPGGRTLRRWAAERARSWAEVVRVLIDAGAGLAAAHRAGIVHGDFKPDNVLIGDDGRGRVVDFGMAVVSGDPQRGGTRRYMAPEQLAGRPATAGADQFAFAISALELLPAAAPRAIRAALARARQADGAQRFGDMDALIRALRRRLHRRRTLLRTGATLGP